MDKSRKEKGLWWDRNWELLNGCQEVSPACTNCFAMKYVKRFESTQERWQGLLTDDGRWNGAIKLCEDNLYLPKRVKKPTVWFVTERGDIFHPSVPNWFLIEMWKTMEVTPWHTYVVLTKRAGGMMRFFKLLHRKPVEFSGIAPLENVYLGVTVEINNARWRIADLLEINGYKKFISYEPALGSLELSGVCITTDKGDIRSWCDINGIIVGCESGPHARETKMEWIRDVKNQCVAAGVPVFIKQAKIDGKLVKMPEIDGKVWNQLPWEKEGIVPKRIQRKRTRGWKMPDDAIYIGRPTKWGNPFPANKVGNTEAVRQYRVWLDMTLPGQAVKEAARKELRGKDLACWCKEGEACHGDVLLSIANRK